MEHLPECDLAKPCDDGNPHRMDYSGWDRCYACEVGCFCDALRACEQRVNGHRLSYENGVEVGYDKGYVAGLDAAREAVERVSSLLQPLGPALAAIDALREEQK